jgi:glucan phosphoethanolaminetransferase (alkaline phosphatase superfamily)
MKTQRATQLRSFFVNMDEGSEGLQSKANIQNYVERKCRLKGTKMRTYDYALLYEEDEEMKNNQHDAQ